VPLRGGVGIPQVGIGVFQVPPDEAQQVVEQALAVGYRHVDTAAAYVNEAGVGAGLRASGLPREEVFVTSKLRNGDQGYDATLRAYDDTLGRLGIEALDLYLIHWPNPAAGLWQDSWRALEKLLDEGRVRAIGVSNFLVEHLQELASDRGPPIVPAA
jgi:diketogulonate reductase-like aldo/keto reductase